MIFRWVARLWRWLTDDVPPKHPPPPYPHGDPPGLPSMPSMPPLRLVKDWGDAVSSTRRDEPQGLDWDDDEDD